MLELIILIGVLIYFAPSVIAMIRNHDQKSKIVLINMFLGWTAVGWIGTFIWAIFFNKDERENLIDKLDNL